MDAREYDEQLEMRDAEIERLRRADKTWHEKHFTDEIERLRTVLREAMHQSTAYDGLDPTKIGPQHWYTQAMEVLPPNS
jgi:16S rRNA U1498 N3-methylase RsmE